MSFLRTSVVAALAMSATLASAQGTSVSVEQRLQQLEAEQAAMKQQLAERDAAIQELKRELAAWAARRRRLRPPRQLLTPAVAGSACHQVAAGGQVPEAVGSPEARLPRRGGRDLGCL